MFHGIALPFPRSDPFYFVPDLDTLHAAVSNRLLGHDLSSVDEDLGRELGLFAAQLGKRMRRVYNSTHPDGLHIATFDTILLTAPTNKKKLYTKVVAEIRGELPDSEGVLRPGFNLQQDGGGMAFSKIENYFVHDLDTKSYYANDEARVSTKLPRPRCIVARNLRHVLYMARLLHGFEEWVYENCHSGLRTMFKGLNSDQAAMILREKWLKYRDPIALCGDCSSFDGHVSKAQLQAVHKFYYAIMPELRGKKEYTAVFKAQLHNVIKSRLGLSFVSEGRRMSGDRDTAFGNTLLTYMMIHLTLASKNFELACDGDDFVVICERADSHSIQQLLLSNYKKFGHELEFDVITSVFECIDFCQKKPVELEPDNWKLVRSPLKVLSATAHSTRNFDTPQSMRGLFASIGIGDFYCSSGVPVLASYARMVYRLATGKELIASELTPTFIAELRAKLHPSDPLFQRLVAEKHVPARSGITQTARVSFSTAYGIGPVEQLRMEAYFDSLNHYDFQQQPVHDWHPAHFLYTK